MPNADVFISYRRDQREQVLVIAEKLQELGLSVWFDARLEAGTSFDEEINREVRSAKAVLVCWSAEAVESRWVRAEASIGLERDVLVAVFLHATELMPPYNLVHAANLEGWNGTHDAPAWREILGRIGRLTGRSDLAEIARARALDAQWVEKDAAARADFAAKLEEARRRFSALHESRPAAFGQSLDEIQTAFDAWLLRRRTSDAGAPPDPLRLVEDQTEALRSELEVTRRERDAAATRLQAMQSEKAVLRATEASEVASTEIRSVLPIGPFWAKLVAVLAAGPFALIWLNRRIMATIYLTLLWGFVLHRAVIDEWFGLTAGVALIHFAALALFVIVAAARRYSSYGSNHPSDHPTGDFRLKALGVACFGPIALAWLNRRVINTALLSFSLGAAYCLFFLRYEYDPAYIAQLVLQCAAVGNAISVVVFIGVALFHRVGRRAFDP